MNRDILNLIGLNLELNDLYSLFTISNNINKNVFWMNRLIQDYQIDPKDKPKEYQTYKEYYQFILKKLKKYKGKNIKEK